MIGIGSLGKILIAFYLIPPGLARLNCPTGCECINGTMTCDMRHTGRVDSKLPKDIKHAVLHNWGCWNLTWDSVVHLELFNTLFVCQKPILQLEYLVTLKIHEKNFYNSFDMLNVQSQLGLKELYFVGNYRLSFLDIARLLNGSRFSDLETLVIDRISTLNDDPDLFIPSDFFTVLQTKTQLRRLEMINLHLINIDILATICPPNLLLLSLHGSIIGKVATYYETQLHACKTLRVVDLSQTKFKSVDQSILRFVRGYISGKHFLKLYLFKYFYNVETVNVSHFSEVPMHLNDVVIDTSFYQFTTRRIDLSHNNINVLKGKMVSNNNTGVEEYILSSNILEFISPRFFQPVRFLKIMRLDSNRLYAMQDRYPSDFRAMLQSYTNLEYVDLSSNGLRDLSVDMFSHNTQLRHIDLGQNKLVSISFSLSALVNLKYLGLNKNRIIFSELRDIDILTRLNPFVDNSINNDSTSNVSFQINLAENSFMCTCHNIDLQLWMLDHSKIFREGTDGAYVCRYNDNDYSMITDDVKQVWDKCYDQHLKRLALIIAASLTMTIVIVCLIAFLLRRQIRHNTRLRKLMQDLQNDDIPIKFLTFLSHSSADDDLVINYVLPSLSEALKTVSRVDRDLICHGDKHFRPGHVIVEEVMRSVEQSAVAVLVISNTYVKSPWCDMEAKEAATQQKPVILILTEMIDEKEMSPVMKHMFNRFVRFKCFTNDEGQREVVPSWETLAANILELASVLMNI